MMNPSPSLPLYDLTLSSPMAKHFNQNDRLAGIREYCSHRKYHLLLTTLILALLIHFVCLHSQFHRIKSALPFSYSTLASTTQLATQQNPSTHQFNIQVAAVSEQDIIRAMQESGKLLPQPIQETREVVNTAKKAAQDAINQEKKIEIDTETAVVGELKGIEIEVAAPVTLPVQEEVIETPAISIIPISASPTSTDTVTADTVTATSTSSPTPPPTPSPSSSSPAMFEFTEFSTAEAMSCFSNTTVTIAGNSNSRAFYFRFLSKLTGGGTTEIPDDRIGQKAACALDEAALAFNSNTIVKEGAISGATCKQVLENVKLIWNQNIWDLLVEDIFRQEPDVIISLAGNLDVFEQEDWKTHIVQEKLLLGQAIQKHIQSGPNKQFIQLLLPPVCESKMTSMSHFPNVNKNIKTFNDEITEQVLYNGGSVIDYFSLVEGRFGMDLEKWEMNGCPGYDDFIHPGDEIKFSVINDLMNLQCKKVKRPFHHFWADQYARGLVPLEN